MKVKFCTKCKKRSGISNFYKDVSKSDGVTSRCKNCERPKCIARLKSWRQEHPIKYKRALRKWRDKNSLSMLLMTARSRARKRNLEFSLTLTDMREIFVSHCPVFGFRLQYGGRGVKNRKNFASLDRLDNTKGYIRSNVVIISYRANMIKNDGTAEEHRKIAKYMESCKRK